MDVQEARIISGINGEGQCKACANRDYEDK